MAAVVAGLVTGIRAPRVLSPQNRLSDSHVRPDFFACAKMSRKTIADAFVCAASVVTSPKLKSTSRPSTFFAKPRALSPSVA